MAPHETEDGDKQGSVSSIPPPRIYSRDEHNVSRRNIDRDALKIMYRLIRSGYQAYLVGGGVRDLLLDKAPKDFDIATDARPNQIRTLFRNSRIIGRRFKLAHIYFRGNKIIEVATFRAEETEEVPDSVDDSTSKQITRDNTYGTAGTDAIRRDLTINALFYDLSTFSIIDHVGGMEDLRKRLVRIIGEPDTRFAEDPVRIIRCVRHAVRAGFSIEERCYTSLMRNRALLKECSQVRLYEELRKDLHSGYCAPILDQLGAAKLLPLYLPDLCLDGSTYFNQDSDLYSALARLDAIHREASEVSSTVFFALFALLCGAPDILSSELAARYESIHDLTDTLEHRFSEIALPRKERERIEQLLAAWHVLLHSDPSQLRHQALSSNPQIEDLYYLFYATDIADENKRLLRVLKQALHSRKHKTDKRNGDSRGNGHRRVRGSVERGTKQRRRNRRRPAHKNNQD